jgi:hypothetical protein
MSPPRSYLNPVTRDLDTTSVMVSPGPPGPLTTDKHDGTVHDVPIALVSTYSTAHILDPINPSINPYDLNNDALVKNLANYIDSGYHDNANDTLSTTSSASPYLHELQPNKHSEHGKYKPIKQEGDDKLESVISGVTYTFNSGASIDYAADILECKTVLDEATSSAKPSAPDNLLPDICNQLHKIPKHQVLKIQGINPPAFELAVGA